MPTNTTQLATNLEPLTTTVLREKWPRFVGPELNGIRLTTDEFDAIADYDDDYRYELIDGVLIVNPIPNEGHADLNGELEYHLRRYRNAHPQGRTIDGTLAEQYVYLPGKRRQADRVIWTGLGRRPKKQRDVPSIVVEFVSIRKRDRLRDYVEKREEYLAVGVKEYWIFDRYRRTFTIFRRGERGVEEITLDAKTAYTTPLLPGFSLAFDQLLDETSGWDDDE